MQVDGTMIILILMVIAVMIECYWTNHRFYEFKAKMEDELEAHKQQTYVDACNTFGLACHYLFETNILKLPDDYEGTKEDLIMQNFLSVCPHAGAYLKRKDAGDDVRLEDDPTLSQGRS